MVGLWLFPLAWAVYSSLRPISDTILNGYVSWPKGGLSLDNYATVWTQADMPYFYLNTLVIVIPAVALTLLFASMVAFACTQFNWRFNIAVLMLFTAGNLLPPQVIIVPLYHIYLSTPIPYFTELDIGRFTVEMDDHIYLQRIREQVQGGRESGVRSTPTFFVDGRIQDVSFGLRFLFDAVDAALAK